MGLVCLVLLDFFLTFFLARIQLTARKKHSSILRIFFGGGITGKGIPVKTISTATVMLTASSTLPITALTVALPQSNKMSGLS